MWSFKFVQDACKCCILTTDSGSMMSNSCCTLTMFLSVHRRRPRRVISIRMRERAPSRSSTISWQQELRVGKILEVTTNLFTTNSVKPVLPLCLLSTEVFSRLTDGCGAAAGCGGEGTSSTMTPETHHSSRALTSVMTRFRSSPLP